VTVASTSAFPCGVMTCGDGSGNDEFEAADTIGLVPTITPALEFRREVAVEVTEAMVKFGTNFVAAHAKHQVVKY